MIVVDEELEVEKTPEFASEPLPVPIEVLENCYVSDRNDFRHKFRDFFAQRKTIFIFLRNFLDYIALEYAEDLSRIPLELFEKHQLNLILIGCGSIKFIPEFEELSGFQPIFTDIDRVLYTNLNLRNGINYGTAKSRSPHVKSNMIQGILSSTMRSLKYMEWQSDLAQQGGCLIISPGGIVEYFYRDQGPFDHVPIDVLMQKAGVFEAIDYHKGRIQHV